MDSLAFKVVQFKEQDTTIKVGINAQYLTQGKYVETEVPKSNSTVEALQSAMDTMSGEIETWKNKVASLSTKSFHIEETEESYIVTYSEQIWGISVTIPETVAKSSAQSAVDALSKAWMVLEPRITSWKTSVVQNNLVEGRYFRLQNGQPVLEPQ